MQRRDVFVTGVMLTVAGCTGLSGDDDDGGSDGSADGDDDGGAIGGDDDSASEPTLRAAADVSVDDDTVLVQVTTGGEDLDGILLVDDDGAIEDVRHEAIETGGSYELTAAGSVRVYGYRASTEPSSIDDLDATVNLGSVEFESS